MSEKILEVKHLGKAFGSNQVLRDIDFSVSPGDVHPPEKSIIMILTSPVRT